MTNRTQRLKDALFANPRDISLERALLYTASHQQTEGEPVILRRAKPQRTFLTMSILRFVMRN